MWLKQRACQGIRFKQLDTYFFSSLLRRNGFLLFSAVAVQLPVTLRRPLPDGTDGRFVFTHVLCVSSLLQGLNQVRRVSLLGPDGVRRTDWHDYEAMKRDRARSGRRGFPHKHTHAQVPFLKSINSFTGLCLSLKQRESILRLQRGSKIKHC